MNRLTKLIILIILSCSVYFIYQNNKNSTVKVLSIGDNLSLGINSYGIKEYSYIDYYKDYLLESNDQVYVIDNYSNKDLSLKELLTILKNNNTIKKDLISSNYLILNVGYNDLVYKLSLEDNLNTNKLDRIIKSIELDYNNSIKEIRKYYKEKIIVVGYYKSFKDDYYLNQGIKRLNSILECNSNITYIDTYKLLNNYSKYFSNPNSYYPNNLAYLQISQEIIKKT